MYNQHLSRFDLEQLILNDTETRANIASITPSSAHKYQDLQDVDKNTVKVNGRKPVFSNSYNKWVGKDDKLSELDDVNVTGVTDFQILGWDEINSLWTNVDLDLRNLKNVDLVAPLKNNDRLTYDSSLDVWTNRPIILNELENVTTSTVLDKQVLSYNVTSKIWENYSLKLTDLNDVPYKETINEGDVLIYSPILDVWQNVALALYNLKDTKISSPKENEVLTYNGEKWINKSIDTGKDKLTDLLDVNITDAEDWQTIMYNSVDNDWQNQFVNLNRLHDTNISLAPAPNDVLKMDDDGKWKNSPLNTGDLNDVLGTPPSNGEVLTWNSSINMYEPKPSSGGASTLAELDDILIDSVSNGQFLQYDNAVAKWINRTVFVYADGCLNINTD